MSDLNLISQGTGDVELDKAIAIAGYAYDASQDIFISTMDPWQRSIGYCRLYDEAAAPMGMIIDSDPIYFVYKNKKWMVGIWKGQYDMVTGGEVGVYTNGVGVKFPKIFTGIYYQSAGNEDCLHMAFTLKKGNRVLFTREGRHWWLTGFVLGEFSEPSELTMDIKITLESAEMRDAFLEGMKKTGYSEKDVKVHGNTVSFTFGHPRSAQPFTRTPKTDRIIQRKNELLCQSYQEITKPYATFPEKLEAIKEDLPGMYRLIMNMGKSKQVFEIIVLLTLLGAVILTRHAQRQLED
ncbi:hypothetical protein Desde_2299 [Desulfitobacterium dehalogenans ATCC 51507]|uniref:DUF4474 domain-containing protein n=1 Tax=Desulfitobacterium dehalogenans (strain ATCC 51507 / DSM 9161 / JW/IU-DC1) TaxID=756499 RepID=I4A9K9_DESDJ|nr:DUF4474 domain-containing protein [Desulfitobacterium dehalogenans]AFM00644.1 hypothetical protein Desde_2299 [Desulfitobacterium dehalogenans ATCC 51507]